MTELHGKTAFVSGGSRGIGKAIALKLANNGANVVITYAKSTEAATTVVEKIEAFGVKGHAIQADANDAQNVVAAIDETVTIFGKIDILINNAGIFEVAPITSLTLEDFDRNVNVNIKSVFAATMQAVKSMPEGGRIITMGSVNADLMPFAGGSLYAMSKAAVQMMTQTWARDLGEQKITANVIQPGPVNTDMNPGDASLNPFAETLTNMTALKRYGNPDEIAELALFLASPRSTNITGSAINIDGGMAV